MPVLYIPTLPQLAIPQSAPQMRSNIELIGDGHGQVNRLAYLLPTDRGRISCISSLSSTKALLWRRRARTANGRPYLSYPGPIVSRGESRCSGDRSMSQAPSCSPIPPTFPHSRRTEAHAQTEMKRRRSRWLLHYYCQAMDQLRSRHSCWRWQQNPGHRHLPPALARCTEANLKRILPSRKPSDQQTWMSLIEE